MLLFPCVLFLAFTVLRGISSFHMGNEWVIEIDDGYFPLFYGPSYGG